MALCKYAINRTFFDKIDTEEKAYILGFLYADGYNHEKRGCVKIRLHIQDEELLIRIRNLIFIDKQRPLYYSKNRSQCELVIDNKYMSKQLALLGCVQAKSFKLKFPEFLNVNLIPHFIRGVFDGDGCISLAQLKTGEKKTVFSIIGYRPFIKRINDIISKECSLNCGKLMNYKGKSKKIATCAFSGCRQNIIIRDYLYNHSTIYLQRKYNKFKLLGTLEWGTYGTQQKKDGTPFNTIAFCNLCGKEIIKSLQHQYENKIYCYKCFMDNYYISKKKTLNEIIIKDNYAILIIKDKNILFDIEDIDTVNLYKWHIENGYVISRTRYPKQCIYLHRLLLKLSENEIIKFKDNDKLNCRKNNFEVRGKYGRKNN